MVRCKLTVFLTGHNVRWTFTRHKSEALIFIGLCGCLHGFMHEENEQLNGEL